MILILLASGRGKRCKQLTKSAPKCFIKLNKNKRIIDHIENTFKYFNKVIIVCGYKSDLIEKRYLGNNKVITVKNNKYLNTNMVYSLFVPKKLVKENVIVSYADIIYRPKLIEKLKKQRYSSIALSENWLKIWRTRMPESKILNDAEDVKIKKKFIQSIGQKITNKLPKFQYMGLFKILIKDYKKLGKNFIKIKNKKIDMTSFINLMITDHKIKFSYVKTNSKWYEIDTPSDVKNFKKINFN